LTFALLSLPLAVDLQTINHYCLIFHGKKMRGLRPGDRHSLKRKCGRPTNCLPATSAKRQLTAKAVRGGPSSGPTTGKRSFFIGIGHCSGAAQAFKPRALSRGGPQGSNDDEGKPKWRTSPQVVPRTIGRGSLSPKAGRYRLSRLTLSVMLQLTLKFWGSPL
jgi:hypothetical protein